MKIKRRLKRKKNTKYCECGCGQEVKPGKRFVYCHHRIGKTPWNKGIIGINKLSEEHKRKIGLGNKDKIRTEEFKRKLSIIAINKYKSKNNPMLGKKHTEKSKLKMSISSIKGRNDGYCDAWANKEFKQDCRKEYCESCGRKRDDGWQMDLHHINLDKEDCRPDNFITLCVRCHTLFHRKLKIINKNQITKKEDFIILIKKDKIKYIHRINRKKIEIKLLKGE